MASLQDVFWDSLGTASKSSANQLKTNSRDEGVSTFASKETENEDL